MSLRRALQRALYEALRPPRAQHQAPQASHLLQMQHQAASASPPGRANTPSLVQNQAASACSLGSANPTPQVQQQLGRAMGSLTGAPASSFAPSRLSHSVSISRNREMRTPGSPWSSSAVHDSPSPSCRGTGVSHDRGRDGWFPGIQGCSRAASNSLGLPLCGAPLQGWRPIPAPAAMGAVGAAAGIRATAARAASEAVPDFRLVTGAPDTVTRHVTAPPQAVSSSVTAALATAPTMAPTQSRRHFASGPGKTKKTKIKPYSSLKRRFKILASGEIKRWRAGKRHNASSKTPKQRRQLRRPSVVSPGLARPMRLLNFHGKM